MMVISMSPTLWPEGRLDLGLEAIFTDILGRGILFPLS